MGVGLVLMVFPFCVPLGLACRRAGEHLPAGRGRKGRCPGNGLVQSSGLSVYPQLPLTCENGCDL